MNRFKTIYTKIKNGEYVKIDTRTDPLVGAMTFLSKSVAKCKKPTELTFKIIDQLLEQKLCSVTEIFEEAVYKKNIPVLVYLINLYKSIYIKNEFNDPYFDNFLSKSNNLKINHSNNDNYDSIRFIDSAFLTKNLNVPHKANLFQYVSYGDHIIENIFEYDSTFEFINFIICNGMFMTEHLTRYMNRNTETPDNDFNILKSVVLNNIDIPDDIYTVLINSVIKYGRVDELDCLFSIIDPYKIENRLKPESFFSVRSRTIESTKKLYDNFRNYKSSNINFTISQLWVEEQIELLIIDKKYYNEKRGINICNILKYLLSESMYSFTIDFFYLTIVLLLKRRLVKNIKDIVDSVDLIFEFSGLDKKIFAEDVINKNDRFITLCGNVKKYIEKHGDYNFLSGDTIVIDPVIFLNFCYRNDIFDSNSFYIIHDYYLSNIKNKSKYINWENLTKNPYFDNIAYVNFMRCHESYRDLLLDLYTADTYYTQREKEREDRKRKKKIEKLNMKNVFTLDPNDKNFILELLKINISKFFYPSFILLADLFPNVFNEKIHTLYDYFLSSASDLKKLKKEDKMCKYDRYYPSILFEYFYSKNVDIGENIYYILKYTSSIDLYQDIITNNYLDIYNHKFIKVFENLCYGSDEKFLFFVDKFPNFGHLITTRGLCCSTWTPNENRLLFLINYIETNNVVFDFVLDNLSFYMLDDSSDETIEIFTKYQEQYIKKYNTGLIL